MTLPLTEADVDRFREGVARHIGLRFEEDRRPLLEETLSGRLRALHLPEPGRYLAQVVATRAEALELGRRLTVNETYFLRHMAQFTALSQALPELARRAGRGLRLLSAGCSTGEEAWSLAMTLLDTLPATPAPASTVTGIDLNPDAVAKARAGRYGRWSMREIPEDLQQRHLRPDGQGWRVHAPLAEHVRFEVRNLVEPDPAFWSAGAFDVIFCRNVLMYFTPEAAREVVSRFEHVLAPGGLLFLGHAETLRGLSRGFGLRHEAGAFFYERRPAGEARDLESGWGMASAPAPVPSAAADGSWFETIARASTRIEELTRPKTPRAPRPAPAGRSLGPVLGLLAQDRFDEALRALEASGSAGPAADGEPDARLLEAVLLVGRGDVAQALAVCQRLLASDDLSAGAHYVMAQCREQLGDTTAARDHLEMAAHLEPAFAMAHLQRGLMARRAGDLAAARQALARAAELFPGEDAGRMLLFGAGFGRQALEALSRSELAACGEEVK